jgi:hypothetical protein
LPKFPCDDDSTQLKTDNQFRGRVVSVIAMVVFGMLPLGSLLIGKIVAGMPTMLAVEGLLSLIIGISFYKNLRQPFKK